LVALKNTASGEVLETACDPASTGTDGACQQAVGGGGQRTVPQYAACQRQSPDSLRASTQVQHAAVEPEGTGAQAATSGKQQGSSLKIHRPGETISTGKQRRAGVPLWSTEPPR
jgi:hypothetical protein